MQDLEVIASKRVDAHGHGQGVREVLSKKQSMVSNIPDILSLC